MWWTLLMIWILWPVIKRVVIYGAALVALAVAVVANLIRRLRRRRPQVWEELKVVETRKRDEWKERRVSYLEEAGRPIWGTIKAAHKHLGKIRLFVKWDNGERDSFVHADHPLLTIH
jgi:hypothetical protein